ncbi:MAG: fibronectin type III domain-containing protein [Candidatus Sumerlaeota bacterium]|nr:fibronectin type III domain-containing protein [Candidatus Sumerlaeota bacterium]
MSISEFFPLLAHKRLWALLIAVFWTAQAGLIYGAAPSNPGAKNIGLDSITWTWKDNSSDETGFKVWANPGSGAPVTLQTTTSANVQEWLYGGLAPNAQYSFQVAATSATGDSAKTPVYTTFTLIETVSDLTFTSVSATSISVAAFNTPSNLGAGFSGLFFANSTAGTSSSWQPDNAPWESNGLTPNAQYRFTGKSRNGGGYETAASFGALYTLAAPPSPGNNVTCDQPIGPPYPGGTIFTFSNPAGFGVGTHGGSAYKVSKFKYVWDRWAAHTFTGTEDDWSTGVVIEAPSSAGYYRLHLQSYNAQNAPGDILHYGPFWFDNNPPAPPVISGITPTHNTMLAWSWASGGAGNGMFRYQLDGTAGAWTPTTAKSYAAVSPLPEGIHTLYVEERDVAGNWSAPGRFSITIIGAAGPESDANNIYWDDPFPTPGANGVINAIAQDASGNLYFGGDFSSIGDIAALRIAKWTKATATWSALETGMNGAVMALAVDRTGNLYAGGQFTAAGDGTPLNYIAKWNGSAWSSVGLGMDNSVLALAADRMGNIIYAGGAFTQADGQSVNYIAMWDGAAWTALGSGMYDRVLALTVDRFDRLYAGGSFVSVGEVSANHVAMWNGTDWSALGFGMNDNVYALTADGAGNIYAGGIFTMADEAPVNYIAGWNGTSWTALGLGMDNWVDVLALNGAGGIYAGGKFATADGAPANCIAEWNGTSWSALGTGMSDGNSWVSALARDSAGNLYAGGYFTKAGDKSSNFLAKWNGASWSAIGTGVDSTVSALAIDSTGSVYAGGQFTQTNATAAAYVAKWNGQSWAGLGSGMSNDVHALAMDPLGILYAGGSFTFAGGVFVNYVAKWDGVSWSSPGAGMDNDVYALVVDGAGQVYAGGGFTMADRAPANYIAKWNGASWLALGAGMNDVVSALARDPSGDIFAGGAFTTAGGVPANHVARWNGSSWAAVGTGMDGTVSALAVDAAGIVYAGGSFTTAGGMPVACIAAWNGASWSALGSGMNGPVHALSVDESGNVFAGGDFTMAGGTPVNYAAKWDGSSWSALGVGMDAGVRAIAVHRNALFAGGWFVKAGGKTSGHFASWQPRVNHIQILMPASPGVLTLGADAYGFYKPALITNAGTVVSYSGGLPAPVTLERAPEIHVGGKRVNGAFTLAPEGMQFNGTGATLQIEFSEDDAAAYGVSYAVFTAVCLTYPPNYPATREAAGIERMSTDAPAPIRVENGRQIYAITVPFAQIGATYGAVPKDFRMLPAPTNPGAKDIGLNSITWTWKDNSSYETGFNVYDDLGAGPPATLQTSTTANAHEWRHGGLLTNTQYAMQATATNSDGESARTAVYTTWTLIEAVTSLTFPLVTATSISVAASNVLSNLASTSSGLCFANATAATSSGWQQSDTPWDFGGLTPNTPYLISGVSRNGGAVETTATTGVKYTLAGPPSDGDNVVCDRALGTVYPAGVVFTFSNPDGFGAGVHGGDIYKVSAFKVVWSTATTHLFTGAEDSWTTGDLVQSPSASGAYYLHLQSRNGEGVAGGTLDYGPFRCDLDPPSPPLVAGVTPTSNPLPTWDWLPGGGGIGLFRYELDVTSGAWALTGALSFTPASPLMDGVYTLYVQELDDSGNWSTSGRFSIAIQGASGPESDPSDVYWDDQFATAGVNQPILALARDVAGNIYAGGFFTSAGAVLANNIAMWNGSYWAPLGTGMKYGAVEALATDGLGNLYAGGVFTMAGGKPANHIAKWDGTSWTALGSGTDGVVYALAVDGAGAVYAGGNFTTADGRPANCVAKWDGASWSALGSGMDDMVLALAVDEKGVLYAGGDFSFAGGKSANYLAKWNGASWSAMGARTDGTVRALAADGAGHIYAAGGFWTAGGAPAKYIARWDGSSWSALGTGMNASLQALAVDGAGNVYAGGNFTTAGGASAYSIAKWDGTLWSPLGTGMDIWVSALTVDRNALFAGGLFAMAGGKSSGFFACWQPRVNRSQISMPANPGAMTLGDDADGFYKPSLMTDAGTVVSFAGGLPVIVTMDRAPEIRLGGARVNGAFALGPEGAQFTGTGAALRIEFSEDDVAAYGASYTDFIALRLIYPADYPANKEAGGIERIGGAAAQPIRIENGRQIYAITVPCAQIGSTYSAAPRSFAIPPAPANPGAKNIGVNTITWTWQDNSLFELGFRVWDDPGTSAPSTLQTTTTANIQEWRHDGLAPNAQYSMQVASASSDGDSSKTANYTTWTLIEAVSALTFSSVSDTSISVAASNAPSNLSAGSSGLSFINAVAGTDSGWRQENTPWESGGLTPNTLYQFSGASRNGGGNETAAFADARYTLAAAPSAGNNIASDRSISTPYPVGIVPTFWNPAGFGAGTHGGSAFMVNKFRYVWDALAGHVFDGGENEWVAGTLAFVPTVAGNYYLHLQSFNEAGEAGAQTLDYGPFQIRDHDTGTVVVNVAPPAASWTLTDGIGQVTSGTGATTITGVNTGAVSITWLPVPNYDMPTINPMRADLAKDATVVFTGFYTLNRTLLMDYLAGRIELDADQKIAADVNRDGSINAADLIFLLHRDAGN